MPRYIGRSLDSTINNSPGDQHWSNVSLLLRMDGSDASTTFTDSSATARTFTANGNAQIDTAQSKFGGASGLFDGTGDYITTPNSADFRFGSGDFTIESWVYLNAIGQFHPIANQMTNSNRGWMFDVTSGNKLRLYGFISSWQELGISTTSLATGQWYHCAVTRDGTSFRLFLNGVLEDTTVISGAFTEETSVAFTVGYIGDGSLSRYVNGWIDDLRITKGVARHTASFTIPDAPFHVGAKTTGHTDNKYNSGIWSISGSGNDSINTRRRSGKWPINHYLVDILVVGGGGGGGGTNPSDYYAGGGGAGGFRTATSQAINIGTAYTITVGTGGAGGVGRNQGANGSDSSGLSITAAGGGGGGAGGASSSGTAGTAGGSGGGASGSAAIGAGNTPSTSPSQGNNGGLGTASQWYGGGGGGGAGGVGGNAATSPTTTAGLGGAGTASSITGGAITYAGGGGGGIAPNSGGRAGGSGGAGGGGAGGLESNGVSGTANLGGGGGGSGISSAGTAKNGGAGGSGVVILKIPTASYSGTTSGSPTITTSGDFTIVKFTASGTYTA